MTRDEFLAIVMEEGATRAEAEQFWNDPPPGRDLRSYKPALLQWATRVWLIVIRRLKIRYSGATRFSGQAILEEMLVLLESGELERLKP